MLNSHHLRDLWSELDALEVELGEESRALEKAWDSLCQLDAEHKAEYEEAVRAEELLFLPPDTVMKLAIGERVRLLRQLLTALSA